MRPNGLFTALWNPRLIEVNPLLVEIEEYLKKLNPKLKRISSGRSGVTETLFSGNFSQQTFISLANDSGVFFALAKMEKLNAKKARNIIFIFFILIFN